MQQNKKVFVNGEYHLVKNNKDLVRIKSESQVKKEENVKINEEKNKFNVIKPNVSKNKNINKINTNVSKNNQGNQNNHNNQNNQNNHNKPVTQSKKNEPNRYDNKTSQIRNEKKMIPLLKQQILLLRNQI